MNGIKIVHVVAMDSKRCIGKNNQLAWHIPADLAHFKNLTTGGVIILGRKTFDSLGRLLPKRIHHVITRETAWQHDGVRVAHDLDTAIKNAKADASALGADKVFIIGGGEIYRQSLPIADVLEITHVQLDVQGDTFYPALPETFKKVWQSAQQTDDASKAKFYFARYQKDSE